jgi:hypothetical protein
MKRASMLVRKLWRETGHTEALKSKDTIGALTDRAARHNAKNISPQLRNNVILFDEFAVWLVQLATILIFEREDHKEAPRPPYSFLVAAICSMTLSIRHQVVLGHDIGAKILVRSLSEYVDVLALLIVRPELVAEFCQENDSEANKFWHRHVKNLKARRALWHAAAPDIKVPMEWDEWRKQEDTVLSVTAHPSFVAAVMSVVPLHRNDTGRTPLLWPAHLGCVTDASIRTLRYAMYSLFILAALNRFPFGQEGLFKALFTFDEGNNLHRSVQAGRQVLVGIISFLSHEGFGNLHYEPPVPPWIAEELCSRDSA